MDGIRKVTALTVSAVMLLTSSCAAKKEEELIKEYDEDTLVGFLEEELDIDEDDIYITDSEDAEIRVPDGVNITCPYGRARLNAFIFEDEDDARNVFEDYYDMFEDTFNVNDQFEGDYDEEFEDDYGYITLEGDNAGTTIFGDRYMYGGICGGIYYAGHMVILIYPEGPDARHDVEDLIDAFGYPYAD